MNQRVRRLLTFSLEILEQVVGCNDGGCSNCDWCCELPAVCGTIAEVRVAAIGVEKTGEAFRAATHTALRRGRHENDIERCFLQNGTRGPIIHQQEIFPLSSARVNAHTSPETRVVNRRGVEKQTKESARRYAIYCVGLGHMFLLAGARPYVSIGWLWAWRWAICFYCVCVYVYMCVCVCVYVYVCVCVFLGLRHHREGTCWRYISSSNKLKLKYTLTKLCVNELYKAAAIGRFPSSRH